METTLNKKRQKLYLFRVFKLRRSSGAVRLRAIWREGKCRTKTRRVNCPTTTYCKRTEKEWIDNRHGRNSAAKFPWHSCWRRAGFSNPRRRASRQHGWDWKLRASWNWMPFYVPLRFEFGISIFLMIRDVVG